MNNYPIGRIGIVVRGDYNPAQTYEPLDLVSYQGGSYVARKSTTGKAPTTPDEWMCVATANIELRKSATHIQWRNFGGNWEDLVDLSDLMPAPTQESSFVNDIRTGGESISVNPSKGATETITKAINFETPRLSTPKHVFVSATSAFSPLKMWHFSTSGYTTTGFKVHMTRSETTTATTGTVGIVYCAI